MSTVTYKQQPKQTESSLQESFQNLINLREDFAECVEAPPLVSLPSVHQRHISARTGITRLSVTAAPSDLIPHSPAFM